MDALSFEQFTGRTNSEPPKKNLYSVYALIDPRDIQVFYVGMSERPAWRYRQHIAMQDKNSAKAARISEILDQDMIPFLKILESLDSRSKALNREQYWTMYYARVEQASLTNGQGTIVGHPEVEGFTDGEDKGRLRVKGPYRVKRVDDGWEIVESNGSDGYISLRPRLIYAENKREAAYRRLALMNRKWQREQTTK